MVIKRVLAAHAHHQVGRLIDLGHQHLQMWQGDVTQHHGLLGHRTRAVEHGTGPVAAVGSLLGEVPVDEHRQQPVRGGAGDAQALGGF